MKPPPHILIIAGPNGAGKTTFAREFLPLEAQCFLHLPSAEMAIERVRQRAWLRLMLFFTTRRHLRTTDVNNLNSPAGQTASLGKP